jgi:hypothetical protein
MPRPTLRPLEFEIRPLEVILLGFGMRCRVCGCTDKDPCWVPDGAAPAGFRGCYWAEPGLCSVCAGLEETRPPCDRELVMPK